MNKNDRPTGSIRSFFRARRHLRRLSIAVAIAVAIYTLVGFLLIPALARSIGQRKLSELLHRQVTIDAVRLNPYALSATVRGLRVRDRDGARDLFSLKEVYVNLAIASIFKGGIVVQQLRVDTPAVDLIRTAEDRYNFSDVVDDLAAGPPAPSHPDGKPARFSVSNIQLVNGHIQLDDRWKKTRHEIAGLNLSVPFVSNFPYLVETFVQPAFSAVVNGTLIAIDGTTKPFAESLESSIEVDLRKVDLPHYLAYVPVKLRMKVLSAILDTRLRITFVQYHDRPAKVAVAGNITLSDVHVTDEIDRPLLKLPMLDIAIASSDLLSNHLSFRHVLLKSLDLQLRRNRRGDLQVQSLLGETSVEADTAKTKSAPKSESARKTKETTAPTWLIEVDELELDSARIVFSDASNAQPFNTTLEPLTVSVKHFTTAKDGRAAVAASITTEAHEQITVDGKLGVAPFLFDGVAKIRDLSLPRFAPYYASQVLFDVRQGKLDLTVPARVAMKGKELEVAVTGLATELRDLQLRRRNDREDFLRLPLLAIHGTSFDLGRRELVLGDIATADARIRLERGGPEQPWSLETLTPAPPAPARAAEAKPATAAPAAEGNESALAVTVEKLDLKGWSVRIDDRAAHTPATTVLDRVGLHLEGIGTARGKPGRFSLQARLNQTGTINLAGTLGITPLQANVQLQLKTLPVVPVQPYFQDRLALLLTSGHIGADGRVVLTSAAKGPVVTYKGEVSAGNFVAVSRDGSDELLRLGSLRVRGIDLLSEPFKVDIGEIALRDYAANIVINADQTLNLATIVPPETKTASPSAAKKPPAPTSAKAAAPSAPAAAPLPVHIGALVLGGGTIKVEDRSTRPAFATSLTELAGRIAGLSFNEAERATVAIEGKLGNGPIAIAGQINPLAKQPFIDLTFKLSDLDLSAMTPYSGKYAGYAVERGQLYLDLKYLIDARKLDAKNNVRVSQFTFGHAVDSQDATKLPVRLAVSLLKDRHGVIQLDVPVSGSLDDPKFSVWGVVLTVVKNLLIKAATSPFALIGSLFGGGEELAWLEFEPGHADLATSARPKIETLAKALFERPALRLEVEGHASRTVDLPALRRMELLRKVKAQKVKQTVAAGGDGATVSVGETEYAGYLKRAYEAEPGIVKPTNALGMLKDISVADMERLLLGAIAIGDDDLRLLARQRADVARGEILRTQKIDTERVFLVEPKSFAPTHKDKVRDSRVDFRLQ